VTHETGPESGRQELIEEILDHEQAMFVTVPSRYPAPCQANLPAFRLHRAAQFSVWSLRTLRSYRDDLIRAAEQGRNLMTLKYARMANLIPCLHQAPETQERIRRIVSVQVRWQKELASRYPRLLGRGRPLAEADGRGTAATSFSTYLRGELETYSEETLALLDRDVAGAEAAGWNLTEGIYRHLVRGLGYRSLEDAEERIRQGKA
jgi:hypothetical protein